MKKIVLLSIVLLPALIIQAQEYTPIKNLAALQQYKKAKEDLDKEMGKAKFSSKPEAYILKTAVYAGLAADPKMKGTEAGDQLLTEAETSWAIAAAGRLVNGRADYGTRPGGWF